MKELDRKAINNILNYCVRNGIEVKLDTYIDEDDNGCEYVQFQLNTTFGNSYDVNSFAFFYGIESDDVMCYSLIVELDEMSAILIKDLKAKFDSDDHYPFESILFEEDDDTNVIHIYGQMPLNEVDENSLDALYKYLSGDLVAKLVKLGGLDKYEKSIS